MCGVHMDMCRYVYTDGTEEDFGCPTLPLFITLRKGLSLNLELSLQPSGPRDFPVSAFQQCWSYKPFLTMIPFLSVFWVFNSSSIASMGNILNHCAISTALKLMFQK